MDEHTDDVTLVRRVAAGDRDALATLFDRFAPVLIRVVWVLAPTPDHARTVVQDVFGVLWERAGTVQLATASLLPWLLATGRDLVQRTAGSPPAGGDPLRWIRDVVDTMAPNDRSLCERCVVVGRPYPEAALDLGLTVTSVDGGRDRPAEHPRKAVTRDGH